MPPRRQSVSVQPSTNKPGEFGRKRAASMAGGEVVPQRPALFPRKSILKPPLSNDENSQDVTTSNVQTSIGLFTDDATEAFDFNSNQDTRMEVHDNTSRKSLGRRVSFASHAHVRVFDIPEQNTNSSGGPSSSPTPSSPLQPGTTNPKVPQFNNENDYPGQRPSVTGPRPSVASSENGETDMSMDDDDGDHVLPVPPAFFTNSNPASTHLSQPQQAASDDSIGDEEDDEDMDVTEAIALNIRRKRSLSIAQQSANAEKRASMASRRRSSVKPPVNMQESSEGDDDDDDMDITDPIPGNIHRKQSLALNQQSTDARRRGSMAVNRRSSATSTAALDISSDAEVNTDSEEHREFTIPLSKALKKPQPPSDAWLALAAVTHSGSIPDDAEESVDMELTNALSRLAKARSSFAFGQNDAAGTDEVGAVGPQDEVETSFTSTEDSFDRDDMDSNNHTMNVTNLMNSVHGMGSDDFTDNGSSIIQSDFAGRIPSSSSASGTPSSMQPLPQPSPRPRTAGPVSPTKQTQIALKSKLQPSSFSASIPMKSLKSPQKAPTPSKQSAFSTRKLVSPMKKRPANDDIAANASPAKKQALSTRTSLPVFSKPPSTATPFSPTKHRANIPTSTENVFQTSKKTGAMLRRPSGYFAQRKSLATGGPATAIVAKTSDTVKTVGQSVLVSPTKAIVRRSSSPVETHDSTGRKDQVDVGELNHDGDGVDKFPADTHSDESMGDDLGHAEEKVSETEMGTSDVNPAALWRSGVQEEDFDGEQEDGQQPPISIEQFFMMTGVKFMDELTVPRRSTVHPSQLRDRSQDSDNPPSLSEFVTAMNIDVPQFELYSWVAKDLGTWIEDSKEIFRQAEEEVAKMTPGLFREFSQANEEGRSELLHQLKLIKANNHMVARSKWYEWKTRWVENLYEAADKGYAQLESDKKVINDLSSSAEELLPELRKQHAQVMLELEQEQADVADVANSDPAYLGELKATIDEQNALLLSFRGELAEGNAKIERLTEKLAEVDLQKRENMDAIEKAKMKMELHKNSTRAEVFRLKDELESLQTLHSWRATKIQANLLEFIYDSRYRVVVPCLGFRPIPNEIDITTLVDRPKKQHDQFPVFTEFTVFEARRHVSGLGATTTKQIIERLSDFWASCAQLRSQFKFLGIKYPISLKATTPDFETATPKFAVITTVLFHKVKAKTLITFMFDGEMITCWPMSIRSVSCDVQVVYGTVDHEIVRSAVMERLGQATVDDNHACLLDACVEATTRYE